MKSTGNLRFEFRVLGPFQVVSGGRALEIGSTKQRALLALLLIHLNRVVSLDVIGDELWEGSPPASLGATVQSLVYRIRKLLGADAEAAGVVLRGRGSGYVLEGDELQLDAHRFERLAARGRELATTGASDAAARAFRDAVALWRGPALDGLTELPFARLEATRLEGARLLAVEGLAESELARGRAEEALCLEAEGAPPYAPFVEILESALAQAPSPEAFRAAAGDGAPEIARLVPRLRRLFPDIGPAMTLPPEQERRYLFNSSAEMIARNARAVPTVFVLEDLHWADEATLLLLDHLARHLTDVPLLIVGTYRDVELDFRPALARTLDGLVRQRLVRQLHLARLPERALAEMLAALSGQEPPATVVDLVFKETEGNPFFVEEVFRHLAEEGRLLDQDGRFRSDLAIGQLDVPENVRLVVGRRLDRLSEDARRVLGIAAVIGRTFRYELLEAAADLGGDAVSASCFSPSCSSAASRRPTSSNRSPSASAATRRCCSATGPVYSLISAVLPTSPAAGRERGRSSPSRRTQPLRTLDDARRCSRGARRPGRTAGGRRLPHRRQRRHRGGPPPFRRFPASRPTVGMNYHDVRLLERVAGIASAAGRRWDTAEAHFEAALQLADELPHRIEALETRRFYGRMLFERDGPGDRDRAVALVTEAAAGYRSLGMPRHVGLAEALLGQGAP
jgi:DNA-binding SARP family transcriptional activator